MMKVMHQHRKEVDNIKVYEGIEYLIETAKKEWDEAIRLGEMYGYRNSQTTLLAPTGTISFMMDCDTTGIEPELNLIKTKQLSDGNIMIIENRSVKRALKTLGYNEAETSDIMKHLETEKNIEKAPHLKKQHLPVFDCANKHRGGERYIHHMGHVEMMAAVQPFLSGAISKTVNLPSSSTKEDIKEVFIKAWQKGLKSIAVYRDESRKYQPLVTEKEKSKNIEQTIQPIRKRLPLERDSITHKFEIGNHEGYITIGKYEDGTPGEIFIKMAKEGSTVSGLMDTIATLTSIALQYGVPTETLVDKFAHTKFDPGGPTKNKNIPFASSVVDYIFRYLGSKTLPEETQKKFGIKIQKKEKEAQQQMPQITDEKQSKEEKNSSGKTCPNCGAIMEISGGCLGCAVCGTTSGCS